ncbi:MAG: B12-binding domain-containing radical SAM protein [Desulfobacteraceae bacterium]|nr:B12-binding domain-containing radical SAM protein [Desulfobacteraceae bacterium]MBU4055524.1 B12-binding domain-containing radical SAM protein [Pseudomonadota bacterium]
MPHILLIQPPIRDFYLTAKRTIPYGLSCIAASLLKAGFSVEILDALATSKSRVLDWPEEMAYLEPFYGQEDISPFGLFHKYKHYGYSFEHLAQQVKHSGAFLVGISSLFTAYSREALEIAERVKKASPRCKVVLGGHHPTAMPEQVLDCESVDFVLRGEGEVSMPLLAKALGQGADSDHLASIPGIGFRLDHGKYFINKPAVMDALDDYPIPAMGLVKNSFYRRKNKGSLVITASRGCPMNCSYCSLGKGSAVPYRRRSVPYIIEEIQNGVVNLDAGFMDFEDENLALDKKWFMALLNEIHTKFSGKDLEFRAMNGLYPPSLDEEIVAAMKAAGFKTLNLAVASTNPSQLKRFSRPDVSPSFEKTLDWAEKWGMDAVAYMIAGAPDQKPEDSLEDLLYLADKRVLAGLSIFYPAPGSADYDRCRENGLLPDHHSLLRSSAIPLTHTTSRTESVTLLRLSRILNFMKSLVDEGGTLPGPEKFNATNPLPENRKSVGIQLLKWFLSDGEIRGITGQDQVYEHRISRELSAQFLEKLDFTQIRGCLK